MKRINVKEQNRKYFELTKLMARGEYPSKRVVKIGSIIGVIIGIILILGNVIGLFKDIWILIAGLVIYYL